MPKRDRERVQQDVGDRSMTKQSFAAGTNPNTIVAQYKRTGVVNHITSGEGAYGEFDQHESLQGAFLQIEAMQSDFAALGARVRDEADNDPLRFAEMLEDEEGTEALVVAGLQIVDPDTGEIREPKGPEGEEVPPKEVVREEETVTE